jgi:hypothetical protein
VQGNSTLAKENEKESARVIFQEDQDVDLGLNDYYLYESRASFKAWLYYETDYTDLRNPTRMSRMRNQTKERLIMSHVQK